MLRGRGHTVFEYRAQAAERDPARSFDPASPYWQAMNARVAAEIREVAQPHDFLCLIAGRCQESIARTVPLLAVEYGVGYGGVFADFCVFESVTWRHTVYGALAPGADAHQANGRFYDAVVPNYFDVSEFPEGKGGAGYAYVGRLIERKGFQIAADVCQLLGEPLIIAGEGTPPAYGEYVGVVGPEERARIMGAADALFVPTLYVEPFGGVAVEAMLCGTPVITTDWGAFSEYVVNGVNGFRCNSLAEFVRAAQEVGGLDRGRIRRDAIRRFSMETVAVQYEDYFHRLTSLWRDGWYEMPAER
jgi:hypothetical protein